MTTTAGIILEYKAQTSSVDAAFSKISGQTKKLDDAMLKSSNSASTAFGKLNGLIAGISFLAVIHGVESVIDKFDKLSDTAEKLDVAPKKLQQLTQAAKEAGVSADTLESAIFKLNLSIAQGANGSKEQANALARLGLYAEDLAKIPADKRILLITQRIKELSSGTDRTAVSFTLFGRAYKEIAGLTTTSFGNALKELQNSNFGLDDEKVKKIGELGDKLSRLKEELLVGAADFVTLLQKGTNEWLRGVKEGFAVLKQIANRQSRGVSGTLSQVNNATGGSLSVLSDQRAGKYLPTDQNIMKLFTGNYSSSSKSLEGFNNLMPLLKTTGSLTSSLPTTELPIRSFIASMTDASNKVVKFNDTITTTLQGIASSYSGGILSRTIRQSQDSEFDKLYASAVVNKSGANLAALSQIANAHNSPNQDMGSSNDPGWYYGKTKNLTPGVDGKFETNTGMLEAIKQLKDYLATQDEINNKPAEVSLTVSVAPSPELIVKVTKDTTFLSSVDKRVDDKFNAAARSVGQRGI